jgi:pimeloyl-ACP methyl ester carboxylesterase
MEMTKQSAEQSGLNGRIDPEEIFQAEQNARVVKNAEAYYRAMYLEVEALDRHLSGEGKLAKIAVWAHNSHFGDARATAMGRRGELNIRQFVREKFGRDSVLIDFTTHEGTVTAAPEWGGETERKWVRPALPGSYEESMSDIAEGRIAESSVRVNAGSVMLEGDLRVPQDAKGVVLFAHGSGSSRHSSRNRYVARLMNKSGLGTLLIDLLTVDEERVDLRTAQLRFNIGLLAERLVGATDWLTQEDSTRHLPIGYFGASTGAAAALVAAAERAEQVRAVVSRGGRPDLAGPSLEKARAPTLLIVGGNDLPVIELNERAYAQLNAEKRLVIIPGATHLFEETGALDEVARLATQWFLRHLG